jgi:hypothetical protein
MSVEFLSRLLGQLHRCTLLTPVREYVRIYRRLGLLQRFSLDILL